MTTYISTTFRVTNKPLACIVFHEDRDACDKFLPERKRERERERERARGKGTFVTKKGNFRNEKRELL